MKLSCNSTLRQLTFHDLFSCGSSKSRRDVADQLILYCQVYLATIHNIQPKILSVRVNELRHAVAPTYGAILEYVLLLFVSRLQCVSEWMSTSLLARPSFVQIPRSNLREEI